MSVKRASRIGRTLVELAIAGAVSSVASAQQPLCGGSTVILNGASISFSIDSVAEWKFDCYAGREENYLILLHRPRESSSVLGAIMYAAVLPPGDGDRNSAEARISAVETKDGSTVVIRQFVSKMRNSYELVAYIPSETAVPILGLRAFTERALTAERPAFDRLVRSFVRR